MAPQQLTYVALVLFAAFGTYGAAVSVLLRAALRGLVKAPAAAHSQQDGEQNGDQTSAARSNIASPPVTTP